MNSTSDFLALAKLATQGHRRDVVAFLRRMAARSGKGTAALSASIMDLLENEDSSPMRLAGPIPVDLDSRFELLRVVNPGNQEKPILTEVNDETIMQVLRERENVSALRGEGLYPTKSLLMTGPPGLGKTMSVKWMARQLGLPLLVLDLSTVMSSLLGKTGGNLRAVIDFAKSEDGILFLDEFDSVAKRRDDEVDIGELKRLVTVLLQEIDNWPHEKLLVAATNHEELLDPAVWRRFDLHLRFELPDRNQVEEAMKRFLSFAPDGDQLAHITASVYTGRSFCDIERELMHLRKQSLLTNEGFTELLKRSVHGHCRSLRPRDRKAIAVEMVKAGVTQLDAHEWTGAARDTIRSAMEKQ